MKHAVLLHGTGGNNTDYFWFEDTKNYLEGLGYTVWWPLLPNTNKPNIAETKEFLQQRFSEMDDKTIIVAHSSACPLVLHLLENNDISVYQVFLVAGYYQSVSDESTSMLPEHGFDWKNIKTKAKEFVFINSDNDPWGCTDERARVAASNLQAPLLVAFGQGHMGSASFNQPYREFKLLKRLVG